MQRHFQNQIIFYINQKHLFFLIAFFVLLFILMIVLGVFIDNAQKLELGFKDYFSMKNIKANKQIKKVVIQSVIILLLCALSFCLGSQSKYVAENNAVILYSLFQEDQEYINYDDVVSVEVKAEYHSGIHTAHSHSSGRYRLIVILNTDTTRFEADEYDFGNDYSKIMGFLDTFDSGIVTADKESIIEMQSYNNSEKVILDSIMNRY